MVTIQQKLETLKNFENEWKMYNEVIKKKIQAKKDKVEQAAVDRIKRCMVDAKNTDDVIRIQNEFKEQVQSCIKEYEEVEMKYVDMLLKKCQNKKNQTDLNKEDDIQVSGILEQTKKYQMDLMDRLLETYN